MNMRWYTKLCKMGKGFQSRYLRLRIPAELSQKLKLQHGDTVELFLDKNRIIVKKVVKNVKE